jgi:nicotinate-nucleotide--dimethylbenzimidazole phosphoribosyltransferase
MFPNIRLLVVAVLAAIAGIGCGLGLFATFRVNHEPLARLSDSGPPLQLALDRPLPRLEASAAPAVRYPLSAPIVISTPVAAEPPNASEDVPENAAPASAADLPTSPTIAAAAPGEPPSKVTESKESAPSAAAAPDEPPSNVTESKEPAPSAAAAAPGEPPSNVSESKEPAAPTAEAAAPTGRTSNQPASDRVASAEVTPAAAETPRAAPVEKPEPAEKHAKPQESKVLKPPAKTTRAAAPARRVVAKVVRGRRTITTVAAVQPIGQFSQANYQWVDPNAQFQSAQAQPVRRVVVIKRRQVVKPAAAPPPAPEASTVPSATAGVLGGQ